jgi:hypothetical protein
MLRLHAACLAAALTGTLVHAQAPPAGGKKQVDDAEVRRLLRRLAPVPLWHQLSVSSITFAPDGKTITTVCPGEAKVGVWDAATGELLKELRLPQRQLRGAQVAAGGKVLAAVDGLGQFTLWDVANGKQTHPLKGAGGRMALAPDGQSLVAGLDGRELAVWDTATGKLRCRLEGSAASHATGLTFSPDGTQVAAARLDGSVGIWDARTGRGLRSLPGAARDLRLLAFTPDNKGLAVCDGSGVVRLWELGPMRQRRQLRLPAGHTLNRGFFLPDGRTLLTGGTDGVMRLWELASGKERHAFPGRAGSVLKAALAPDGQALVTVGTDNVALVREVGSHTPSERALTVPPRPQTLAAAWADLAAGDAAQAYRALTMLAGQRAQAVAFLKERLRPAAAPSAKELARLLKDLDSPKFAQREKAVKELGELYDGAEEILETAIRSNPPLEVRRRLEKMLQRLKDEGMSPKLLQAVRAVEVLELIGTAEARQVLRRLVRGEAHHPLTEEAQAALERLGKAAPR